MTNPIFLSRRARAAALALGLTAAAPASAQYGELPIPRSVVLRGLEADGFEATSRMSFDGRVYIVEGYTPRGFRVRLTIDAYDGDILRRTRIDEAVPEPRWPEREEAIERPAPPPRQRQATRPEPRIQVPAPPARPRDLPPPVLIPPEEASPAPPAPAQQETRAPRLEIPDVPAVEPLDVPPVDFEGPSGVIEASPEADPID